MSTYALEPETLTPVWPEHAVRVCKECRQELPETLQYFEQTGTKGRGYLRRTCRRCTVGTRAPREVLGMLPVEPLRELLLRLAASWKAEDKRFDDFAESVGLRARALFRIINENRHVQFDVVDRVLTNTAYSIYDLYPEYRDDDQTIA